MPILEIAVVVEAINIFSMPCYLNIWVIKQVIDIVAWTSIGTQGQGYRHCPRVLEI
jgi:hypothetical protein